MLVGQLQSGIQRVLADDQSVLVCHYHSSETDVGLLALLDAVCVGHHILLDQRVSGVQSQIHLPDRAVDSLPRNQGLEFGLAFRQNSRNQILISGQASMWFVCYLTYTMGSNNLINPSTISCLRKFLYLVSSLQTSLAILRSAAMMRSCRLLP